VILLTRSTFHSPVAGLDPAIHVFLYFPGADKDVDPRVKPGGGDFFEAQLPRQVIERC